MRKEISSEQVRHAWNSGLVFVPKPPLKPKDHWEIRAQLRHQRRIRDLALLDLAIDSKLRDGLETPRCCHQALGPERTL